VIYFIWCSPQMEKERLLSQVITRARFFFLCGTIRGIRAKLKTCSPPKPLGKSGLFPSKDRTSRFRILLNELATKVSFNGQERYLHAYPSSDTGLCNPQNQPLKRACRTTPYYTGRKASLDTCDSQGAQQRAHEHWGGGAPPPPLQRRKS